MRILGWALAWITVAAILGLALLLIFADRVANG